MSEHRLRVHVSRPHGRSFIIRHRAEILAELRRVAPDHPFAAVLVDELAASHANDSVLDITPAEMTEAFALVRDCILAVWERSPSTTSELREINRAIDRRIVEAVGAAEPARSALAKLESLLTASPVGIAFVDRDMRYLRINDALAAVNGMSAAEHVGRRVADVLGTDGARLEALLQQVLTSGEPVLNLELTRTTNGQTVLANYFPVRMAGEITGVGAVVVDITATKHAERALAVERARLQSIIEHAPAAIWVKDPDGKIVLANHRLAAALGHPYDQVIDQRSQDLLPQAIAEEHQEHDRIVRTENRSLEVEEQVPSPDGLRTFLAIKFPIPGDPPLVGGIATEITDRKRIEEELRVAVRLRDELLAVVSHDLRNPLGTIKLGVTMVSNQVPDDPRAHRYLEMITRASLRMENLIDDLLDSAKIRAGRLELALARHSAQQIAAEALELQQALAAEKGVHLSLDRHVRGVEIICDRNRIMQVFANLIGNAIKFCRASDTIRITADCEDKYVRFSICDTGPGVPVEVLPHLFEPYRSGRQHADLGAGLGLYIVRGIVEAHGGKVGVESQPGVGATFFFTIPIAT
jgi:PAS domain S-box-containing protein